jgi:hypothetical protein
MASGSEGPKQTRGYFVPLGNCAAALAPDARVFQYSGGAGAGGSFLPGNFSPASWVAAGTGAGALLSSISSIGQGGLFRDMGKTVVSSNRTFRKVQLVTRSLAGGVTGADTTSGPYLTGYIELGTGNALASAASPAPVAYMPGLL